LIDAPSDSPIPADLMSHENRIALLRSNRSMSASELGRLLGGTSFYGPTYVLMISTFCEAFPDMPREEVSMAALMWNGVGGNQTDEEFDQTLGRWLGPVRN
jgi:hypothetical protein